MNVYRFMGRARALLLSAGLALLALPMSAAVATDAGTMTTNPLTICSSQAVPAGFVVLSAQSSSSCGGFQQLSIAQTTASDVNLTICSISPLLGGNWIYTNIAPLQNSGLCTQFYNQMQVHQVQAGDTSSAYCNYSQSLPAGWAVTSVNAGTGGPCAQYQSMTASRLSGSAGTICDIGVNISSPWVATQVFPGQTNGQCKNYQQMNVRAAVANGVPMSTCGVPSLPPPAGFVISGITAGQTNGPCANYTPQTIMSVGNLTVGTQINVCSVSPVPSGWVVVSNNPWQAGGPCASFATNTIRRIA